MRVNAMQLSVSTSSARRCNLTSTYRQNFTYFKDSQHALEIFRDFHILGQNKLIFNMDITSLSTVIPNDEGLRALKHFYDQCTVKEPSSKTQLRQAEVVLTLNCFSFDGNYYKQTAPNVNSTAVTSTTASALPPLPGRSSLNLQPPSIPFTRLLNIPKKFPTLLWLF